MPYSILFVFENVNYLSNFFFLKNPLAIHCKYSILFHPCKGRQRILCSEAREKCMK